MKTKDEPKHIKGKPLKTAMGEIVPGFSDQITTGEKITSTTFPMGMHAGDCTVKHNRKKHKIQILHNFGAGISLQAAGRYFHLNLEAVVNHAIAHGLLADNLTFEQDNSTKD